MRIGFLGGTFNPPHNGHIGLALAWSRRLTLDRFFITPTGTPPHKAAAEVPGEIRLEMCRLAAEETGGLLEAFDFEVRRSGQKSYSVITLSALHELYPGSELFMVMGADMFVSLESWHDFDRLKTLATFCTVPRDGIDAAQLERHRIHLAERGCHGLVADLPEMDISSSEIRRMVREGQPVTGLVPVSVERFIESEGLYR
ncbi:MAG: nicotinate (nicotinamide) nucleotide adenylyltransferase [Clostridia bacterium]|nr:nicotinate (nicotinamide) nucleotide adenylyltransferase [Clostridia bacterium]